MHTEHCILVGYVRTWRFTHPRNSSVEKETQVPSAYPFLIAHISGRAAITMGVSPKPSLTFHGGAGRH